MKGKFYESEYEEALIDLLQNEGWIYKYGKYLNQPKTEVLLIEELEQYLITVYPSLTKEDMDNIINTLRHTPGQTHFKRLRNTFILIRDGFRYERKSDGKKFDISFIDFEHTDRNIFTVVNQLDVFYNQDRDYRTPDVLLYVNGIPLCIFELKNPTDEKATIAQAYDQIHIRYMRDIPRLLQYIPLSCISDATINNTRLGTTYTPYEHYYSWKKVNNEDPSAQRGIDQVKTIVKGVYEPVRFLEILRDYVYFPDKDFDGEEEIVCRYPQFFASRILRESVRKAVAEHSSKGGTYFGATGCGKTYTMLFLARQLSLRCDELGSPTIIMIVDRDDLQNQAGKLFLRSTDFLGLGVAKVIESRKKLKEELSIRDSGGFFICTIQKFCEEMGELNTRHNIICFSDEAHRTQIHTSNRLKIVDRRATSDKRASETERGSRKFTKERTVSEGCNPLSQNEDEDEEIGVFITKPYAEQLRTAFPNATFVGFTGTPIAETIQVFGKVVDRYTMRMAVEDEITKDIKYIPRLATVTLESQKLKEIEEYYSKCAEEGATKEDILASKRAMSEMERILGDEDRLERLAADIISLYEASCANKPDVRQKAMVVCSKRWIGYTLLKKFQRLRPEWFEERKYPVEVEKDSIPEKEFKKLHSVPTIAMVATRGRNDDPEMWNYLGDKKRIQLLDEAFKQEYSNFRIVIVVDMWITGFDVPCLTYLYNDKPLQRHSLVQTVSRVNRKFPGKEFGFIIDYIGIRTNMIKAMKEYGGEDFGPSEDDVQEALGILKVELEIIKQLFSGFDLTPFCDKKSKPAERLTCLEAAVEWILTLTTQYNVAKDGSKPKEVDAKTFFLAHVKRLKTAYDICQPSNVLTHEQNALSQSYMAISGCIRKASGEWHDTESMNQTVKQMVEEALKCNSVISILESDVEESIFSPEFLEQINEIKLPATRLEVLLKMLRQSISQYKDTNKLAAEKFEKMLIKTVDEYHNRRSHLSHNQVIAIQKEAVMKIIQSATEQALAILKQLGADKESFRKLGLTFQEKAFYDILLHVRDKYNCQYGEDKEEGDQIINEKCKDLAKKVKVVIDKKSAGADWLTNSNVKAELNSDLYILLHKNGYPEACYDKVINEVMEQISRVNRKAVIQENYAHSEESDSETLAAEPYEIYEWKEINGEDMKKQEETILIGCYRDKRHREWIIKNHLYNIRMGKRKGATSESEECFEKACLLYLYDRKHKKETSIYKITSHKQMGGKDLAAINYPRKSPGKSYMTFSIGEINKERLTPDLLQLDVQKILSSLPDHKSGSPVFITKERIQKSILKE